MAVSFPPTASFPCLATSFHRGSSPAPLPTRSPLRLCRAATSASLSDPLPVTQSAPPAFVGQPLFLSKVLPPIRPYLTKSDLLPVIMLLQIQCCALSSSCKASPSAAGRHPSCSDSHPTLFSLGPISTDKALACPCPVCATIYL